MKIVIVDNYDSFTYNLKHYFDLFCEDVEVVRNDDGLLWKELETADRVVLSPGPGLPGETTNLFEIIKRVEGKKPLLGVCLGHQAIAEYFGETIFNLDCVLHGKSTPLIQLKQDALFTGLPKRFNVARYHSWSVNAQATKNAQLAILATDEMDRPLAIKHKTKNIRGVQFHPESILTEHGKQLINNWITFC